MRQALSVDRVSATCVSVSFKDTSVQVPSDHSWGAIAKRGVLKVVRRVLDTCRSALETQRGHGRAVAILC